MDYIKLLASNLTELYELMYRQKVANEYLGIYIDMCDLKSKTKKRT